MSIALISDRDNAVQKGVYTMLHRETVNWDKLPVSKRLDKADCLARRYGIADVWYWRDSPANGHELVMVWMLKGKTIERN